MALIQRTMCFTNFRWFVSNRAFSACTSLGRLAESSRKAVYIWWSRRHANGDVVYLILLPTFLSSNWRTKDQEASLSSVYVSSSLIFTRELRVVSKYCSSLFVWERTSSVEIIFMQCRTSRLAEGAGHK